MHRPLDPKSELKDDKPYVHNDHDSREAENVRDPDKKKLVTKDDHVHRIDDDKDVTGGPIDPKETKKNEIMGYGSAGNGGVNPGANTGAGVNVSKTVGERINFHENGQWSLDKAAMPDKRPIKRGEGGPRRLTSQQKVDSKNQDLKIKEMQEQIKSGGPSPRKQEEAAYDKIRQKDNDARQQHRAEEDKHNRKVREAFRERQKAKE